MKISLLIISLLTSQLTLANNSVVTQLMNEFKTQGAETPDSQHGQSLWNRNYAGKAPYTERSCSTCHSNNLTNSGKHTKTGKPIKPLAPSVNQESLSDDRKIRKWFKRNCKWTLGRECSAQEKADILSFISQQ